MAVLTESDLAPVHATRAWPLAGDDVLARAAATGSDAAYSAIFTRYHGPLLRYCRSILLDPDDAQDAAQNALAAALRALRGDGPQPRALKPWLYRTAHHEALAVLRRRPATAELDADAIAVAGPADDDVRERLRELVADLRSLPERQRGALLMRELSGLEYDEIGDALGTTPQAARQTVFEARAALHAYGEGRATACVGVRRTLSDGDRRMLRGRRMRAHLRACDACAEFATAIDARRRDLAVLVPVGPALALLAGAGATGGGGALVAGMAAKCAAVCATAAIVGAGSVAVIEDQHARHRASDRATAQRHATAHADGARAAAAASASARPTSRQVPTSRPTTSVRSRKAAAGRTTAVLHRGSGQLESAVAHTPAVSADGVTVPAAQRPGHAPVAAPREPAAPTPVSAPPATNQQATSAPAPTQPAPAQSAPAPNTPTKSQQAFASVQAIAQQVVNDARARLEAVRQLVASAFAGKHE